MKLCIDCKHYAQPNQCFAPKVVSVVDGSPGDSHMQRYEVAVEGDDYCGREGKFWAVIPPKKKNGVKRSSYARKKLAKT